jgi:hypothetical protein
MNEVTQRDRLRRERTASSKTLEILKEIQRREEQRDRRSELRRRVDANRKLIVQGYSRGLSWAGISELIARRAGIRDPSGGPLPAARLRRLVDRIGVLYDQPDPSAPRAARNTVGVCPLAVRWRGIPVSANR